MTRPNHPVRPVNVHGASRYLAVLLLLLGACHQKPVSRPLIILNGLTMGTGYSVKIAEAKTLLEKQEIQAAIDRILAQVNQEMSTYRPDSHISRINQNRTTSWQRITPALYNVIHQALHISIISKGSFDITMGALVNLWGFGPNGRPVQSPSDEDILTAREHIGLHHLQLSHSPPLIKKDSGELYLDLSGIAKGYAVDRIADHLEGLDIRNYMVEIGGEIRASGKNEKNQTWQIGIERPLAQQRQVQRIIPLKNIGLATSGDYRNYYEDNGRRYSHVIDPVSGRPITHNLASVTVLHKSTSMADGLATALLVLGLEAGYQLATQENIAALFIYKTETGFQEKFSPQFQPYLIDK